jgi:hypothetical protein
MLRQDSAQRVAATARRERKDDFGQRTGLAERIARFHRQRRADASRNEISAVHFVYPRMVWSIKTEDDTY